MLLYCVVSPTCLRVEGGDEVPEGGRGEGLQVGLGVGQARLESLQVDMG